MSGMINNIDTLREFAKQKHNDAGTHYGDEDYIVHLDGVHKYVVIFAHGEMFGHKLITVERAAYGHDLIEDTDMSYNDVREIFGKESADVIFDVTDKIGKDRTSKMLKTLPKIRNSRKATLLKMSDRYFNGKHSKDGGHSLYKRYKTEYPIFRFALKKPNRFILGWKMLDELFGYEGQ